MTDVRPRLLFLITEDWTFWEIRRDLARIAKDAGYDVLVATRVTEHADRIQNEGFQLIPISMRRRSRNPFRELMTFIEVVRLYCRTRPKIVHHVAMKPIIYGSLAAWMTRIPVVINVFAGLGYAYTDRPRRVSVVRAMMRMALKIAVRGSRSMVVFQNRDDQELLARARIVTTSHVRLIAGSGVDITRFSPGGTPADPPIVMLVGRMLWDKGVGEFVEAALLLKKKSVRARFVLVGRCDQDNPSAIEEEQLNRWAQEHSIEWWGHREDLPAVFGVATLVVLPSYREGLPKVMLEAAACGKAMIATDVPGCRDVIQHRKTGLLVPVRDPPALADAVHTLLENQELRVALGVAARDFVRREHSTERIGRQYLDLYQECLRRAKGPRVGRPQTVV